MEAWSSWNSEDSKTLSSILNIVEKIPADNDNEIFDLLDEEKSIILNSSKNNEDCSLFINVNKATFPSSEKKLTPLTDILIVSEARAIETFINAYHEYYGTFQSVLISNLPDTKIYKTLITFSNPQKHVLLKLKSLFCKETVWIYGIFIKVMTECPLSARSILLEECGANRIDSILKEKNVTLSEKAENFKKLYSLFNVSQNQNEKTLSLNVDSLDISNRDQLQCLNKLKLFGETENSIPTMVENADCQKMFSKLNYENFLMNKMKGLMSQTNSPCYSSILKNIISANLHKNEEFLCEVTNSPENNVATLTSEVLFKNETCDNSSMNKVHDELHKKLVSDSLESLIEKKFNEFEVKMKVQIENSNLIVLNKLSHLETLLMKALDNKTSS